MMADHDEVEKIGFTKTEAISYLGLLEIGSGLTGTVAKHCNLYRKNVADALSSLNKKGFVTYTIRNKRKHWKAVNPKRISEHLQDKKDGFDTLLPELLQAFKKGPEHKTAETYEGKEGMKAIHNLIIEVNKPFYNLGATGLFLDQMPYFSAQTIKKLDKMECWFLFNHDVKNLRGIKQIKRLNRRYLPKEFKPQTQFYIFGDHTAIINWKDTELIMLIHSRSITKGVKDYFEFLWRISSEAY